MTCSRGLAKNTHRLVVAGALVNLFLVRKSVLRLQPAGWSRHRAEANC